MNILPKFLYLFQPIPLPPPSQFFSRMMQLFTKFIWNNRRTRLRPSLLYLPYERGGLQLPSLQWYFWLLKLQLCVLLYAWTGTMGKWVQVENICTKGLRLIYTLHLSKNWSDLLIILLWETQLMCGTKPNQTSVKLLSCFSTTWGNDHFSPGRKDPGFKISDWFSITGL